MATVDSMALLGLLQKCGMDEDVDFLREATRTLVQALMDAEVSAPHIGAERHERAADPQTQRNGYRPTALGHACMHVVTDTEVEGSG